MYSLETLSHPLSCILFIFYLFVRAVWDTVPWYCGFRWATVDDRWVFGETIIVMGRRKCLGYTYFSTNSTWTILGLGARGSVVASRPMIQAGRSPVRVPHEVDFFNLPSHTSRTTALRSTHPLTIISTKNFPGGKKWPARRADNLAAICDRMSENVGASTSRNPKGLHGLYKDNFTFYLYPVTENGRQYLEPDDTNVLSYSTAQFYLTICFTSKAIKNIIHVR
jgi:hypothetical protein